MSKGRLYPAEGNRLTDPETGARIRQVTNHAAINHQPFFFVPAYDRAMSRLYFVSHRTGAPQIFCEHREDRALEQLTDRDDLNEWSVHPSRQGDFVYFTAGKGAWRLDLKSLHEEELVHFGDVPFREAGMVGTAMGTTALSWSGQWWAVPVKWGQSFRFFIINTVTGKNHVALEQDKIGHPQFCPHDDDRILYIAGMTERVWVTDRSGRRNRRILNRDVKTNQWITHESWLPGTGEITFVDWPHAVMAVDPDSGAMRIITRFNAWHAMASWDGRAMIADTNFPDIGLHLFDPRRNDSEHRVICYPEASSLGEHWNGPFPYADGPIKVYAPQHTHPHPSFSPDGQQIIFTSDRTGFSQVYECSLKLDG
jgi:oligogalacturonide lyase